MRRDEKTGRKVVFSVLLLVTSVFFTLSSCDTFNKPVREWFEYYTNSAGVEAVFLHDGDAVGTYNGMYVIDSSSDKTVYLKLRNPQSYPIDFEFLPSAGNPVSVNAEQDVNDKALAFIYFDASDLQKVEKEKDSRIIDGEISLSTEGRPPFPSFHFFVMVNSPPPQVLNPMLQLSENNSGTYILCFFVPKTSGTVHEKDTKKIFINNIEFNLMANGTVQNKSGLTDSDPKFITITNPSGNLFAIPNSTVKFSDIGVPSGYTACYYDTKIPYDYSGDMRYIIRIRDDYGLTSEETVSNQVQILKAPSVSVLSGRTYNTDPDTKELVVRISHDGKDTSNRSVNGNVDIIYTVKKQTGGSYQEYTPEAEVLNNEVSLKLVEGIYKITAHAEKDGYLESAEAEEADVVIREPAIYYVSSNGDQYATGNVNNPIDTIQRAVGKFEDALRNNPDFNLCIIYLKDDLAPVTNNSPLLDISDSIFDGKEIRLEGKGALRTIDAESIQYYDEGNRLLSIITVPNGRTLTLKNIKITGCEGLYYPIIENEGTLIVEGSCLDATSNGARRIGNNGYLILKGKVEVHGNTIMQGPEGTIIKSNVLLSENSELVDVSELSSGSKISFGCWPKLASGTQRQIAKGWKASLGNPWDILESDSEDCFIDYDSNDRSIIVLKAKGSQISIAGSENLSFETGTSGESIIFTLKQDAEYADGSLFAVVNKSLICGLDLASDEFTDSVVSVSGNKVTVSKAGLASGSYVLNIRFTYKNTEYDVNLPFTKN